MAEVVVAVAGVEVDGRDSTWHILGQTYGVGFV